MNNKLKIFLAVAIIVSSHFSTFNMTVYAQSVPGNSILHRTNFELSINSLNSNNFFFGSGFLKGHPERSIDLNASIRIWQHLEAGVVLSLQGASSSGISGMSNFNNAPTIDYYYLGWDDNRYHLAGGVMVQLHLNAFDKRYLRENRLDIFLRGGWGYGGQVDGFWFGFGEDIRLAKQLVWTFSADFGQFPYATLKQVADNENGWRFCTGLKISLK